VVTIDNGDDAKDALDRISIPQDVLDRIAPTSLPRSSIIVSDEPLSRETNYRTEFVAVLNNQPQGGFVTRRPTVNVPVASRRSRGDDRSGYFVQGNSQSGNFFFQHNWDSQSGNSLFQRSWDSQTGNTRPRGGQYYYQMQPGQNYYQVQRGWW
jgi:hypothetical protein